MMEEAENMKGAKQASELIFVDREGPSTRTPTDSRSGMQGLTLASAYGMSSRQKAELRALSASHRSRTSHLSKFLINS